MTQNVEALVIDTINEVLVENGYAEAELSADTNILSDTQLDSLGLAIVLVKLEEKTGKDPFSEGFITFFTVAELTGLYAH